LQNSAKVCTELPSQIDKIKVFAGVGIGTGVVGTIGGATASITGIMKSKQDQKAAEMKDLLAMSDEEFSKAVESGKVKEFFSGIKESDNIDDKDLISKENAVVNEKSQQLGNIRTIGSGVAGVANVGGAIASFMGVKDFDETESNMDESIDIVEKINNLKDRAEFETPDDTATIAKMKKIVASCKGLNPANIKDIKNKMFVGGVVSSVGGVTGLTSAILSASAVKKENGDASIATKTKEEDGTKELNTASNILAVGTTVASATGAIIGGVTLVDLNKNGDIAKQCADVFEK
jgi:hypothetical protein